ncbi:25S rRNA (adenine645-N1)-methyltransferase [Toensbergia leucococca]|nr:25S rRNA (adenine645-N1)-methyltransferase [Toensbergia leucococca]
MFAVPGWSVSANELKGQSESTTKKLGKRKRGHGQADGLNITDQNLSDLWKRHIEGEKPKEIHTRTSVNTSSKQFKKKRKDATIEQVEEEPAPPTEDTANNKDHFKEAVKAKFEQGKASKETKRERKAHLQVNGDLPPTRPMPQAHANPSTATVPTTNPSKDLFPAPPASTTTLTTLQQSMRQKLLSSRFRHLNQTLYTSPSAAALSLFSQNPTLFSDYHIGFRVQVATWPENPVDCFIRDIRNRGEARDVAMGQSQKARWREEKMGRKKGRDDGKNSPKPDPLPRTRGSCAIADLGCGDARLASSLLFGGDTKALNLQISSYDLATEDRGVGAQELVTVADISELPLEAGSVDIGIFCLALMGTNWIEFVEEAARVIRTGGELWVAEIRSRFVGGLRSKGGARARQGLRGNVKGKKRQKMAAGDDDEVVVGVDESEGEEPVAKREADAVGAFVEVLRKRGFVLKGKVDLENKMFARMRFLKENGAARGEKSLGRLGVKTRYVEDEGGEDEEDEARVLKPCVYKLR